MARSSSIRTTRSRAPCSSRTTDACSGERAPHRPHTGLRMILELYIFMLAAFTGYMVISRVPPLLHTPLMAATNAISGISLVGSIILAGAQYSRLATLLGFIAVVAATTNIVGGFLIVDRMLRMFQRTQGHGSADVAGDRRLGAGRRLTDLDEA